jgi:membrane protease YdiL (CAAX protease family)
LSVRQTPPVTGFRPFNPFRLTLMAIGIPAISLVLAMTLSVVGLRALGFGSSDQVLALMGRSDGGPVVDGAVELSNLMFELMLLGLTVAVATRQEKPWTARAIGWAPWVKDRSFLPFVGLMLAWEAIEGLLIEPRFPQLADMAQLPQSQPALLISLATLTLVAPIAEETFFRGFVYTNLRAHMGFPASIILSALFFALLHYESSWVLPLLTIPFGLMAGLARERFGSVRPAIYLHIVWNLVAWGSDYFQASS